MVAIASKALVLLLCLLAMAHSLPQFKLDWNKLAIPTLEALSPVLAKSVGKSIKKYSTEYAKVLFKHSTSETEVQIENGCVTADSFTILQSLEVEMNVLQYRKNIGGILGTWRDVLLGQPVIPEVNNLVLERMSEIYEDFEAFIYRVQALAVAQFRASNKELVTNACKQGNKIVNLSGIDTPKELELAFADGPNVVPNIVLKMEDINKCIRFIL